MLEIILNRWRGTGNIYKSITGTMIYALYLFIIITIFSTWYYGIIFSALFLLGESYAFGKWVGYLVSPNGEIELNNTKGSGFPYIHQVANYFIPQEKNYKRYCQLALSIRGFYWWFPMYLLLAYIGCISYWLAILLSIILALGFPLACYLGQKLNFSFKSKYLIIDTNWEKQEAIYGAIQGLALWLALCLRTLL